jgi:hypothetical protein
LEIGKQYDELVSALTADGIGAAYASNQTGRDGLKKSVADGMTERIVDVLESVQVQKQYGDLFRMTACRGDGLTDPIIQ